MVTVRQRLMVYLVATFVIVFGVGVFQVASADSALSVTFVGNDIAFAQVESPDTGIVGALEEVSPYANWQIILAFGLPLVIAALTQQSWSESTKAAAMFGISLIATVVGMWLLGQLDTDPADFVATILKVIVFTIAFYKGVWKPLGVTQAIHNKTG